jgi:hypothetical protein
LSLTRHPVSKNQNVTAATPRWSGVSPKTSGLKRNQEISIIAPIPNSTLSLVTLIHSS